jgi:hypothetical protein
MKRVGAVSLGMIAAIFAAAGCNDYGNTFQNPTGASITSISPSTIPAGTAQFTLNVLGGGFVAKTVVQWNGQTLTSTAVTDSSGNVLYMTAVVPASLIAAVGTAYINTLNPHSGTTNNGLSNSIAFVVTPAPNPVPVVTSISPNIVSPGGPSITLMVTGSDFLPTSDPSGGSVVHWNAGATQYTLPLQSASSTLLQATVASSLLQNEGCAIVSVYNPPSPNQQTGGVSSLPGAGGGTSANAPTFTISTNSSFCAAPAAYLRPFEKFLAPGSGILGLSASLLPLLPEPGPGYPPLLSLR